MFIWPSVEESRSDDDGAPNHETCYQLFPEHIFYSSCIMEICMSPEKDRGENDLALVILLLSARELDTTQVETQYKCIKTRQTKTSARVPSAPGSGRFFISQLLMTRMSVHACGVSIGRRRRTTHRAASHGHRVWRHGLISVVAAAAAPDQLRFRVRHSVVVWSACRTPISARPA